MDKKANILDAAPSPIKVFISSTFVDLVEEFQYLHSSTFPQLNEICQRYGTFFVPFDQRRTAVDYRSSSDFTLKHALDSIKICYPYFMCIIGRQYGEYSLPNPAFSEKHESEMNSNISRSFINRNLNYAIKHGYSELKQFSNTPISLLELEVQYASLMKTSIELKKCHCHFYVQDHLEIMKQKKDINNSQYPATDDPNFPTLFEAEDEFALNRLIELKIEITEKGLPVKFFASKEELEEAILKDWMEILFNAYQGIAMNSVYGKFVYLFIVST